MEDFSLMIKTINARLLKDKSSTIVPLGSQSAIYFVEDGLRFMDSSEYFAQKFTDEEYQKVSKHNSDAYTDWATEGIKGGISFRCITAAEPIFKSNERMFLLRKIGLCYDWNTLFLLAKSKKDDEVEKICKKDLFLIYTLSYYFETQEILTGKGATFPREEQKQIQTIIKDVLNLKDTSGLNFPKIDASNYKNAGVKSIKDAISKDTTKILSEVKTTKEMKWS